MGFVFSQVLCYRGVTRVLNMCYKGVTGPLLGCKDGGGYRGVTEV